MAANRGLVALVALAVVVWSVAFAGGATVAVLSESVNVTTTFETPEELHEINESSGSPFAAATVPVENGTPPAANGTNSDGNASAPTEPENGNAPAPTEPEDGNASAPTEPTDGNASVPTEPTNETASSPTEPKDDQPSSAGDETVTNESAPAGNATAEGSTAGDANHVDAVGVRHFPDPSRSGHGV